MGPPPQLQKGLSMHPGGMGNGPVKAMDMGHDKQSYDKQSYGGQSNMKSAANGIYG